MAQVVSLEDTQEKLAIPIRLQRFIGMVRLSNSKPANELVGIFFSGRPHSHNYPEA
jgi:hypothetical protein